MKQLDLFDEPMHRYSLFLVDDQCESDVKYHYSTKCYKVGTTLSIKGIEYMIMGRSKVE